MRRREGLAAKALSLRVAEPRAAPDAAGLVAGIGMPRSEEAAVVACTGQRPAGGN